MKRFSIWNILLTAVLIGGLSSVHAGWSMSAWLEKLEKRISRADDRFDQEYVSVAAVRGSKTEDDAAAVYWKGKHTPITREELDAFKSAFALAKTNKTTEAQAAFSAFLKDYPASPMAKDAQQTLTLLAETALEKPSKD